MIRASPNFVVFHLQSISSAQVNDDEAERASRRSIMSTTDDEMNLTEANAQLSSCLQMFNENVSPFLFVFTQSLTTAF